MAAGTKGDDQARRFVNARSRGAKEMRQPKFLDVMLNSPNWTIPASVRYALVVH